VTNAATWTSSSSAILSVTNIGTKGKVTTITLGNGTITATLGGKSGQCAVISALSL